jgi:hypothetical protein
MPKTSKVTIGPTQPIEGGNPPNPATQLREGSVPVRHFPDQVIRKPFPLPTKSSRHRTEGPSNDEFNQPGREEKV